MGSEGKAKENSFFKITEQVISIGQHNAELNTRVQVLPVGLLLCLIWSP